MIVPVILCGGSGTRLWPLSREQYPKQFLSFLNHHTLLQNTITRLAGLDAITDPIIICNQDHRFIVAEQLQQIACRPGAIILEQVGRNTAPAVTLAALHAIEKDKRAILLILPADHYIDDISAFHSALETGAHLARSQHLVTFGIIPTSPETGYGYIRKGQSLAIPGGTAGTAHRIDRFVEKPNLDKARLYVDSDHYCWNSGIFMFMAKQILAEMDRYSSDILAACRQAYNNGHQDLDFFRLDSAAFAACPSNSIDYAVMEHTEHGAMVSLDAGWNDLGSWKSLWQEANKDPHGNLISGDVVTHDVRDSYVRATHRLVTAVGLDRQIVVETADAVFVAPRNRAQEVKAIVTQLKSTERRETKTHRRTYHLWGASEEVIEGDRFQVRRITIKPGANVSYQKHRHRAEHWVVVHGQARVKKDDQTLTLAENESLYIPPGVSHQLTNQGKETLEVIEIRTGRRLDEDDIIRLAKPPTE